MFLKCCRTCFWMPICEIVDFDDNRYWGTLLTGGLKVSRQGRDAHSRSRNSRIIESSIQEIMSKVESDIIERMSVKTRRAAVEMAKQTFKCCILWHKKAKQCNNKLFIIVLTVLLYLFLDAYLWDCWYSEQQLLRNTMGDQCINAAFFVTKKLKIMIKNYLLMMVNLIMGMISARLTSINPILFDLSAITGGWTMRVSPLRAICGCAAWPGFI